MTTTANKPLKPVDDVPFTAKLPDGRTLFVLLPAKWCDVDHDGEVMLNADATRLIDRVQTMAMRMPQTPTPGRIRTLREALGLTQKAMAQRLGVDSMTVARWEWGKVKPSPDAVKGLDKLRREAGRRGVTLAA